jgi:hypothetical protein
VARLRNGGKTSFRESLLCIRFMPRLVFCLFNFSKQKQKTILKGKEKTEPFVSE